eukprot:9501360-Pyramimonas_sp.AAC.1
MLVNVDPPKDCLTGHIGGATYVMQTWWCSTCCVTYVAQHVVQPMLCHLCGAICAVQLMLYTLRGAIYVVQ